MLITAIILAVVAAILLVVTFGIARECMLDPKDKSQATLVSAIACLICAAISLLIFQHCIPSPKPDTTNRLYNHIP